VLFIEALFCGRCGGRMKGISLLSDPAVVKRILDHLELPSVSPPLSPARVPIPDPCGEVELEPFGFTGDEGDAGRVSGREEAARPLP
jgi:hypothetical protein